MLFTVSAVIQAVLYSIAQMSVGRLVVGFGVGSVAMVVLSTLLKLLRQKSGAG